MILGRRTYELLNALPAEARDEGWTLMTSMPGWLFSRTLQVADWPGLEVVHEDVVDFVREAKGDDGPELRTLGSLSLVKQLLSAGLVDRLKLVVWPWCARRRASSRSSRACRTWASTCFRPRYWTTASCCWSILPRVHRLMPS
jgi:hypothetical protein